MRRSAVLVALAASMALVTAACDGGDVTPTASPSTAPTVRESPSPPVEDPGSAMAAMQDLCKYDPGYWGEPVPPEGPTPDEVVEAMDAVEEVRGLTFTDPVVTDAVTEEGLDERLEELYDLSLPEDLLARRSRAWQTIGVIAPDTSIRAELEAFMSGQVIGFYDTQSKELVFIGSDDPSPTERVTLAHELTHAIDDQNFALQQIDVLITSCRDEPASAAIALVEGSATFFMTQYAFRYLTPQEQLTLGTEGGGETPEVEPFIERLQIWPYLEGQTFVTALSREGGTEAIDAAFRDYPVSTEQIIHPERYPNDVPTPVDVPDLAPLLGDGWQDLDVMEVGEEWLSLALDLRLDESEAEDAAAGWDGGIYRAWTDGDAVAVVLSTVWDSPEDAADFAAAMRDWIEAGDGVAEALPVDGTTARVLFASDAATLEALRAAS